MPSYRTYRRHLIVASCVLINLTCVATAKPPEPAVEPVTDPVCIAWNLNWVVQRLDVPSKKWSMWRSPDAPLPRGKAVAAVGDHSAIILDSTQDFGGWSFDLHAQKWREVPKSPLNRDLVSGDRIQLDYVGDRAILWGHTRRPPHGAVFDTATFKWKEIAKAPITERCRALTAVVGGKLYIVHGYGRLKPGHYGPLHDAAAYDVVKDSWEKLPPAPASLAHYGKSIAVWRDRIVLVGMGVSDEKKIGGAVYDPTSKKWDTLPPIPNGMGRNAGCAVAGDRLFVFSGDGGAPQAPADTPDAAVYDFNKKNWRLIEGTLLEPRKLSFVRPAGAKFVVWGGWNGDKHPPRFFYEGATYDPDSEKWEAIGELPIDVPYELHPGW